MEDIKKNLAVVEPYLYLLAFPEVQITLFLAAWYLFPVSVTTACWYFALYLAGTHYVSYALKHVVRKHKAVFPGSGSYVLITGASGGFGLLLARRFAKQGWNLIVVARNMEAMKQEYTSDRYTVDVKMIAKDLGVPGAAQDLYETIQSYEDVSVKIVVNNAGFGTTGALTSYDIKRDQTMINLNITTLVELSKLYATEFTKLDEGKILNVGSVAGSAPAPGEAVYSATKSFVNSFSKALDFELRNTGASCMVLCPGATHTGFAEAAGANKSFLFKYTAMQATPVIDEALAAFERNDQMNVSGPINKMLVWFAPLGGSYLNQLITYNFWKIE